MEGKYKHNYIRVSILLYHDRHFHLTKFIDYELDKLHFDHTYPYHFFSKVRSELSDEREKAKHHTISSELKITSLNSELDETIETLRGVRKDIAKERAELEIQKGKTSQAVRSLKRIQEEHTEAKAAWQLEMEAKIANLQGEKMQELAEVKHSAEEQHAELLQKKKDEIARIKQAAEADGVKAISEVERKHALFIKDLVQRHDASLQVEKDKLQRALLQAEELAHARAEQVENANKRNEELTERLEQLQKDKDAETKSLHQTVSLLKTRTVELEHELSEQAKEFEVKMKQLAQVEEQTQGKLVRFREVSLALEAAGTNLKADLERAEGSIVAWKTQASKEEARAKAAEKMLQEKNTEIRRLTQGIRIQSAATERALGRAAAAENREAALAPQLSEARAVAKDALAHIKGIENGILPLPNESFSDRLERSLVTAAQGVEKLSEEEHVIWRRDASFGAWRDHFTYDGKENLVNHDSEMSAKYQASATELEKAEKRLLKLQSKLSNKVDSGTSIAPTVNLSNRSDISDVSASAWI